MPLSDVAGSVGGASPIHSDLGMELKLTGMIGSTSPTPINKFLMVPFRLNIKSSYIPAFKLERVICPAASVTIVTGPMVTPSSV